MTPQPSTSLRVRFTEAWKTLTPEEKRHFAELLFEQQVFEPGDDSVDVIIRTLDTEPTTLAELICEVRGIYE